MMKLHRRKNAIFFTFIAIAAIAILVLITVPQTEIALKKEKQSESSRIETLDHFVDDLEQSYLPTVLSATAYKSTLALIFYINSSGAFLRNYNAAYYEVMLNGTINKIPIDSITGKKIMDNSTLVNWSKRLEIVAKDTLNANTKISINNVSVSQIDPWSLEVSLNANITLNSEVADWKKIVTVISSISIEDFHDPYYVVNTRGAYSNRIKKSSLELGQWNISKVRDHLRNGTYVHWQQSEGPSFLMRFVNDTSNSSCCGIESLVNPNRITVPDQTESYVDYLFWNHTFLTKCTSLYNITRPPASQGLWNEFRYFKMDSDHVSRYNISSADSIPTCL